jgi:hypothetical protein
MMASSELICRYPNPDLLRLDETLETWQILPDFRTIMDGFAILPVNRKQVTLAIAPNIVGIPRPKYVLNQIAQSEFAVLSHLKYSFRGIFA